MTTDRTLKVIFGTFIAIILLSLAIGCFLAIHSIGRIKEVEQAAEELDVRNLQFTPSFRAQIYQAQSVALRARITGDDAYSKLFEIRKNDLLSFVNSRSEIFTQVEEEELYQSLLSKLSLYFSELAPGELDSSGEPESDKLSQIQDRLAEMSESLQPLGDGLPSMELRWKLQRCQVRLLMTRIKGTPKQVELLKEIIGDLQGAVTLTQREMVGEERKLQALKNFSEILDRFALEADEITARWIKLGSSENQFQDLEVLQEMRDEIIEIAQSLGDSRRVAFTGSLKEYKSLVKSMQYSIFIALGMLFVSLFIMGWLAKKAFLYPIETSLAEAEETVSSHEDLANIGTLAAGVAHEIRNPITAIKARLFALNELARTDETITRQVEAIQGETNRMENIVQDFLSFARPGQPNFERTNIAEFLDDVHSTMQPEMSTRGTSLIMGRTTEGRARIDCEQLKQVFLNLVRNAAEACPKQSGEVCLSSRREGNQLLLEVSDNGSGIPADYQSSIFDPFFSKKKGGTGLGLSICKNIVDSHSGSLTFKTSATGTTFTISLEAV